MARPCSRPASDRSWEGASRQGARHAIRAALVLRTLTLLPASTTVGIYIFLWFSKMDAEPLPRLQMPDDPARSVADNQKCERKQGVVINRRLFPRIDDRGFLQHFRHPDDAADGGILKGDQRLRQQCRQHSLQCLGDNDV